MIKLELKLDALTKRKYWKAHGEKEDFICSECSNELTEGFMCENNKRDVFCLNCHDNIKMSRCMHKEREHQHIKFIRGENANE